ncbi:hypothetical protein FOA52_013564 [Chlamydomonas sp. UWO 241]|nr:hypothetical protein FOA52_013564 [Chlamydomonas sp. UWO 241]
MPGVLPISSADIGGRVAANRGSALHGRHAATPCSTSRATAHLLTQVAPRRVSTIACAKGRSQSGGAGRGKGRGEPGVTEDADDWDEALTTGFPASKFGVDGDDADDVEEGALGEEDDILNSGAFDLRPASSRKTQPDEDEERDGDEDEDEVDDDMLGEEGEEEEYEETDVSVSAPGQPTYETDNLDYTAAVAERDKVVRTAQVVRVTAAQLAETAARIQFEADTAARALIPDNAQLTLDQQGYQAFQMDGVDFLVAETPDGRINLSDAYYFDKAISMYARPVVKGDLPAGPRHLQIIPWVERRSPDSLKGKEGMVKMKKVYMLGVAAPEPEYRPQLDEVYCFQASTRTLSRCKVTTIGTPTDPVLRIRADGITIEDSSTAPNPSAVSLGQDGTAPRELTNEERQAALAERIAEMEAQAEQMDELEDAPDVPDSDMM